MGKLRETYQILENHVGDLGSLLNTQILEGLGCWVDDLVVELTLNLIGRADMPPKSLVK